MDFIAQLSLYQDSWQNPLTNSCQVVDQKCTRDVAFDLSFLLHRACDERFEAWERLFLAGQKEKLKLILSLQEFAQKLVLILLVPS